LSITRLATDPWTGHLQVFKAGFFRALAHPVRIRILELLVKGDRSVQELQEALGREQPVVSQQLAVLPSSNIVSGRKEGQIFNNQPGRDTRPASPTADGFAPLMHP
jgi:ArsR family transcriptional regulator